MNIKHLLVVLVALFLMPTVVKAQIDYTMDVDSVPAIDVIDNEVEVFDSTEVRETIKGVLYDSGTMEFVCDGRYPVDIPEASFFTIMVKGINTDHFRLSFDFVPQQADCILMFSEMGRNFGVHVNEKHRVYISTNNHDNHYTTNTIASTGTNTHLDIIYNHGVLSVNGEKFLIELDTNFGEEPDLSSADYSTGETFKGILKDIQVESY